MSSQDRIYATPREVVEAFQFDESVAQVFSDMIARSVPGYGMTLEMIRVMAESFVQDGSRCYDLGCSLGAGTVALLQGVARAGRKETCVIAVDNSEAMATRCREVLAQGRFVSDWQVLQEDIAETRIENASLVTLNFTLQFIPQEQRAELLSKIYTGMRAGGALVISEKILFEDDRQQELMMALHHQFKRDQGYSDMEIAQKRTALENVLLPETLTAHESRLKAVGYSQVAVWFQCFNFASLIAIK